MLTRRLIVLLKKARLACSLTYPTFLPSYGPYGPYGPAVTYGGLGPAAAGPASQCLALPPNYSPQRGGYGYSYGYGYGYGCTGRTGQQVKQGVPSLIIQLASV
ncbi:hypothetical protein L249_5898 [Ophiocordyceps polyrhachis-furcata BCC 54312]|uniref:Uncharacterized protein n=1 Tax=Ophiocordyceps polyrhachis-furcata BCC 54312 TaxID=1330021 RepID=A0A367L096_9HYPO|nr:hypothetical protein L249_5898 [Ophiocordyceps polyrhachis-furcata BCC 54312]